MNKHFVKIFYNNFCEDLQEEVNRYINQISFNGTLAQIVDIQFMNKGSHTMCVLVHYTAPYEIM